MYLIAPTTPSRRLRHRKTWVWVKIKPPGTTGFSPCFHPVCYFGLAFFDPQPHGRPQFDPRSRAAHQLGSKAPALPPSRNASSSQAQASELDSRRALNGPGPAAPGWACPAATLNASNCSLVQAFRYVWYVLNTLARAHRIRNRSHMAVGQKQVPVLGTLVNGAKD